MRRNTALQQYTRMARKAGYKISGGINGGGWVNLARAVGFDVTTKGNARGVLASLSWLSDKDKIASLPAIRKPGNSFAKQNKSFSNDFLASKEFLTTYEWRSLRMLALKKFGAKCQCCGATPLNGVMIHVDHVKPRRHYPHLALEIENLQILCEVCNHGKGNWDKTDWREREIPDEQIEHIKSIMQH